MVKISTVCPEIKADPHMQTKSQGSVNSFPELLYNSFFGEERCYLKFGMQA
jgi:hypothetical protein